MHALRAPLRCARSSLASRPVPCRRQPASTSAAAPDTLLAPLVEGFLAIPSTVQAATGVPLSYAATIALLAIILRGSVSLPVTLWARHRSDRRTELVTPELNRYMQTARAEQAALTRNKPMLIGAATRALAQKARAKRRELVRKHRCSLLPTLGVPLVLQGGLFLATSLMLRYAVIWPDAPSSQPGSPTPLTSSDLSTVVTPNHPLVDASADALEGIRAFVGTSTAISREAWAWCPSLAQADPTYILPVLVGMISLSSLEISFAGRALVDRAMAVANPPPPPRKLANGQSMPEPRHIANTAFQFAARSMSIGFIAIAVNAPAAVAIYWLSSFSMTAVQQMYFSKLDREKAARIIAQHRGTLPQAPPPPPAAHTSPVILPARQQRRAAPSSGIATPRRPPPVH